MFIFTEHLKSLRTAKGITQRQVGESIGAGERSIQDYERGKCKPGFDALIALADFYDVSLDYLVGRSDDPQRR